jgi:hypothetical protein
MDGDSLCDLNKELMETSLIDAPNRESLSMILTFINKQKQGRAFNEGILYQ